MFSYVSATARLVLFVAWTLITLGPYAALMIARWRYREVGRFYWRVVARIIRLRVNAVGALAAERPLMVVSNHASYLDIVVLGSLIPGVFVAKSEVGSWPGFGLLAKVARTVLIDRRRAATGEARSEIRRRLAEGEALILFPEGTSNDGNRVYPFKSALFSVAEEAVVLEGESSPRPVTVQPVSLAYTRVDGLPMGRAWRPLYAWYGAMDLAPHLFQVLAFGVGTVEVVFHDPVRADAFASRKALSTHCEALVVAGVRQALRGRAEA
ncbi:lysophospholipid acyltransferase family protein [Pararhodospirillum photometricum]|uniref:Lyso-ornithine lipid acyltransferase n=1 Tax=Pararhodospirillum photometricum DSM 122 TaxID=1150469 RepID=H6SMC3_PARPM|nr:lysophospholipid acyltransferase family protein [Pararhodospirillum photometricum]CCG06806.1 Lyso-ornithine lipid acyltransferase [Pararhodospirillum photometricum DSM 122]